MIENGNVMGILGNVKALDVDLAFFLSAFFIAFSFSL